MVAAKYGKLVSLGLLTWLLPFLISAPLYSPEGEPLYDIFMIKSILIVFSAALGTISSWSTSGACGTISFGKAPCSAGYGS
ncbi:hypothetical protein FGW20_03435 [Methanoculleus sp. FWC-SCC3]|uniref:Uncharacterized protein n=1 Tax=Methanoculleus methanifontis TaxID=2584086 RepID=A0ABT8LZM7_9EURY|nr:hypothetical protein [Methanoculleus sp. FWC-SCC3]MDN7012112.1 hypothetical protein [Methanoculleus sp. FWC-SCC3]